MKHKIAMSVLPMALSFTAIAAQQPAPAPSAPGTVITSTMRASGTQYGYRPTPQQQTIGYVAQHLEDANYQLCTRMSGLPHAMTAKDSLPDTVKALWPKDTLVARLKASFEFCKGAFETVTDAKLTDSLPIGPPAAGRKIVRARLVLVFVMDLVDHYSQIANYMRLNGMIPPSSYPRPKS